MRRWIAIFFLVLFPLQAVWAAAAPYCQHEKGPDAQHFGHHAHQHTGDAEQVPGTDGKQPGAIDNDCSVCHAGCIAAVFDVGTGTVALPAESFTGWLSAPPTSPPASQPERPNWRVLA
ncbi:MAG: hypothetical protein E6Q34_06735 [Burkholderiaceae bacterium]|nr:MAG: hypothetical protein E6Q34_06735 [Burkholderiaceae bacterium]